MKRLILLALLAGCATPQERQAQIDAQRAAYLANLQRQCSALGYQMNTQPHSDCMLQLHRQNEQNRAALGAAIISRPPPPVYQVPQPAYRPPTTTNCYRVGDNINCQSY